MPKLSSPRDQQSGHVLPLSVQISQLSPLKPGAQVLHAGICQPVLNTCVHFPALLSQLSSVHGSPSWHPLLLPTHLPVAQESPLVQPSPSSQVPVMAVKRQTPPPQASLVHTFPSLQTLPMPLQVVSLHASASVQALPSSQVMATGRRTQPLAGAHVSVVHGLPSKQSPTAPLQTPLLQLSLTVHASLSLHGLPSLAGALSQTPLAPAQTPTRHAPSPGHVPSSVAPLQLLSLPSQISTPPLLIAHTTHCILPPTLPHTPAVQSPSLLHAQPRPLHPASLLPASSSLASPLSSSLTAWLLIFLVAVQPLMQQAKRTKTIQKREIMPQIPMLMRLRQKNQGVLTHFPLSLLQLLPGLQSASTRQETQVPSVVLNGLSLGQPPGVTHVWPVMSQWPPGQSLSSRQSTQPPSTHLDGHLLHPESTLQLAP